MQIVIDMPEKTVNDIKDNAMFAGTIPSEILWDVTSAIGNGIPLPKGHGRLIDADAFERRCMFDNNIEDMQDVIYALRDFKPVLEADKEE